MTSSNLKFKPISKDRLFYDRWQYCISFLLAEVNALKQIDHDFISTMIERRKQYREVMHRRWSLNSPNMRPRPREITTQTETHLHELCEVLSTALYDFKIVTSKDICWIYTNNIDLINNLDKLLFLEDKQYSEAIIKRPKNTIALHKPTPYCFRSYLKCVKLSSGDKERLTKFFNNHVENIRMGPSLINFYNSAYYRTQDYFFFDHDSESWLVMLALIRPGLIRKTLEIVVAK